MIEPLKGGDANHVYDNGGVPPLAVAEMMPFVKPLQITVMLELAVIVIGGGEPKVKVNGYWHAFASVTSKA